MNLNEALTSDGQQFIQAFKDAGWNDEELTSLARAWNVAQTDLQAVIGTNTPTDPHLEEIRTGIIAAQMNAAIMSRFKPSTPAITNATPHQLLGFIDYYETELDRIYRDMIAAQKAHPQGKTVSNPEWESLWAQFTRLAGFLWECMEVSGTNKMLTATAA